MLIKSADDKQPQLETRAALLARSDLGAETRRRIDQEVRSVRSGIAGERDAAYQIDFYFGPRPNWMVIHDLRLEVDGRVAQIDHLLLGRTFDVWVCESKHFAQGAGVNEHGEWTAYYRREARGIPSPVEQNRLDGRVHGRRRVDGVHVGSQRRNVSLVVGQAEQDDEAPRRRIGGPGSRAPVARRSSGPGWNQPPNPVYERRTRSPRQSSSGSTSRG